MMDGETSAAGRRVMLALYDGADEYTGTAPSGSQVQISIAGMAWQQASGSVTKVRDGDFYYEATEAESRGRGFRLLRLAKAGMTTAVYDWYVGERRANDPDATARRIPVYLEDTAGDPVTGLSLTGSELELSIGGSAFASGTGTAFEIGLGAYYYEPARSEYTSRGPGVLNVLDSGAEEYKYEFIVGQENSPAPTGTTAESIRDRIIDIIEGLTPTSHEADRFRAYRNEREDFIAFCEQKPTGAFRRFQVIETGSDEPAEASSVLDEERRATYRVVVAYPQTARAGANQALDRHDIMREDQRIIERAIGMCGRANFWSPYPDACWLSGGTNRETGEACDYLIIEQTMSFITSYEP